jgi:hypothetical protein
VPASDGHLAAVFVRFEKKPTPEQIIECWKKAEGKPQQLKLPSAPVPYLTYFTDDNRPQTKLDRDQGKGMGITLGRLRPDPICDYKFVCLFLSGNCMPPAGPARGWRLAGRVSKCVSVFAWGSQEAGRVGRGRVPEDRSQNSWTKCGIA